MNHIHIGEKLKLGCMKVFQRHPYMSVQESPQVSFTNKNKENE